MENHQQVQSFLNFLAFEKRYSKHTLESYSLDLVQFQNFLLRDESDILMVSHIQIRNWMVSMMEQKISSRSVNRKISTLKSFYKFLMRRGVVKKNPLQKVQSPKISKRLPAFVDETGIDKLLRQIEFPEGYEGARDKIIVELLYGTGMRRSELLHLKESDVDSYQMQIKVLGKGNKERLIPIHKNLLQSVHQFIAVKKETFETQDGNFLLTDNNGKRATPAFVYSKVKKYLSLVTTVDKRSPHTLRHSFATHLMNNGADINAVKELLGHASLAATQVYTHNTIDKLKNIYKQAHPKA